MNVVVLGASNKPERMSYQAVKMLQQHGHAVMPVHPTLADIDGLKVRHGLEEVAEPIDTISVYLSAENSDKVADTIVDSEARRIIFNPGAENPALAQRLREKGTEVVEACTLVLLRTGRF